MATACDGASGGSQRKKLIAQAFVDGINDSQQDILGFHIAPIESVWQAMETGKFAIGEGNVGRFFLVPLSRAITDQQVQDWYRQRTPQGKVEFRTAHLAPEAETGIQYVTNLYGGSHSLIQATALFHLLRLPERVAYTDDIVDTLYPLIVTPLERVAPKLEKCYQGQACQGDLRIAYEFLKTHQVTLDASVGAIQLAHLRRGVVLAISRSWVVKNASLQRGTKDGYGTDPQERYADVAIAVNGGLPVEAIMGLRAQGEVERQMLDDLAKQVFAGK